jgi:hypothetical protein
MVIAFITLTTPGGEIIDINPHTIVALREAEEGMHEDVHCIVSMTDGKTVGVTQTCASVLKKLNDDIDRKGD